MFCSNCGKELKEGAAFCTECGAPVKKVQPATAEAPKMAPPVQGQQGPQPGMPKKSSSGKTLGIILGCVGAAAVLLIAIVAALLLRKPVINLNKYLSVEFEGYNTIGTAHYTIDEEAFLKDNRRKIKSKSGSSVEVARAMLWSCVGGSLNQTNNLTNGDTVVFEWACDDEAVLETFGCKLKYENKEFKVSGLTEAETFNPFDGIEVRFDGISPNGTAHVVVTGASEEVQSLNYTLDKSNGLANTDEVTVLVTGSYGQNVAEYALDRFGKIPSPVEKTFVVEGLNSYITSAAGMPEDALAAMKQQTEDGLKALYAQKWSGNIVTLGKTRYLGYYLLTPKEGRASEGNLIYIVHEIEPSIMINNTNVSNGLKYYHAMQFKNVMVDGEGKGVVDLGAAGFTYHSFNYNTGIKRGWYGTYEFNFEGYSTLDELYTDNVMKRVNDYTVQEVFDTEQESAATEETEAETVGEAGIIFPDSSERLLTEAEVSALSDEDLRSAINEMYARKGYIFKDDTIRAYYEQYDWYTPSVAPGDFKQSMFTETELANVELMQRVRDSR